MRRAGVSIARAARALSEGPFLILAGPGNNGGDAFDAAAELHAAYCAVHVVSYPGDAVTADAAAALERCRSIGVPIMQAWPTNSRPALVIDGFFGIGLKRPIVGRTRDDLERLAALGCPVVAIDVPSGIDANTGAIVGGAGGIAVRATHTITFIGDKPGLHTGAALDYVGTISVDALGCESDLVKGDGSLITPSSFDARLLCRSRDSHKGTHGTVQVVASAPGMLGAGILAARAALYAGAGRVVLLPIDRSLVLDPMHPEAMVRPIESLAPTNGTVVIGPGLGDSPLALATVQRAIDEALQLVIDADALNAIAKHVHLRQALVERHRRNPCTVLTPHPLEAARLLTMQVADIQADRIAAARALATMFHAHVALKGAGTIVAAPDGAWSINPTGNAGLATGGTGDVLAGTVGALLGVTGAANALAIGVYTHGAAADDLVACGIGPIGLTASELLPAIRSRLNSLAAAR